MFYANLIAIILFFIFQINGQNIPEITKVILPEVRRFGVTGVLNCTVARKGEFKVNWYKSGTQASQRYLISSDEEIKVEDNFNIVVDNGLRKYDVKRIWHAEDLYTYQLIVRRLSRLDHANYTCSVQITGGSSLVSPTKTGEILVMSPPSVSLTGTESTITVNEGADITLRCIADGYPTPNITWVRPNGVTMPSPYNDRFTVRTNALMLSNLREPDRGVYRCLADNTVRPPAAFDVTLYVHFAPKARAVQTSYGQSAIGQHDVTLECRISGYPAPDLKWWKDGIEILDDDDREINVLLSHGQTLSMAEFWYQLTIINVDGLDYGDYYCEGLNRLGSDRAKVHLYETSECQGSRCQYLSGGNNGSESVVSIRPVFVYLLTGLLLLLAS